MKNIFLTLAVIGACNLANAQNMFGVKGGLNITNITNTETGGVDESNNMNSFHIGITSSLPILGIFSLQPSLLVTGKGSEVTVGNTNSPNYFTSTTNPIYLQLPVTFNVNIKLEETSSVFFGLGPYIAMGIAGKNETTGRRLGVNFSSSESIDYSDDDPTTQQEEGAAYGKYKRFDYGATFTTGVILRGFMISAFYDLGLAKINSRSNDNQDDEFKNRTLGFSIGYLIPTN